VQLFFGLSITLITYALPADTLNYVEIATPSGMPDVEDTARGIEGAVENQVKIPIVDVASLVFYSGNIVIDMILNSIFAIPSLISSFIGLFFMFVPVDAYVASYLKIFIFAVIAVIYVIGILQFLLNFRSGATVA
jgi:hypothetical protein